MLKPLGLPDCEAYTQNWYLLLPSVKFLIKGSSLQQGKATWRENMAWEHLIPFVLICSRSNFWWSQLLVFGVSLPPRKKCLFLGSRLLITSQAKKTSHCKIVNGPSSSWTMLLRFGLAWTCPLSLPGRVKPWMWWSFDGHPAQSSQQNSSLINFLIGVLRGAKFSLNLFFWLESPYLSAFPPCYIPRVLCLCTNRTTFAVEASCGTGDPSKWKHKSRFIFDFEMSRHFLPF